MPPKVHLKQKITLKTKQEIVKKHYEGARVSTLSREYGYSQSTISTIIKQKERLREMKVFDESNTVQKGRELVAEMERLLLLWIREKELKGDTVPGQFICEKARQIFEDLKCNTPSTSATRYEEFRASKGWFERFKGRTGIKSVIRHGEAASADTQAAEKYLAKFNEIIEKEDFCPQQVFNADETGLFWKKMPKRTYITMEEASLPGHKPMKDRLTLLLGANASGDFKLRPMVVYHSENPRVFKKNKVEKQNLGVFWRCNKKAWVTRQIFKEWVLSEFCPSVKCYLQRIDLPLKALLVLDNAPGHDPDLAASVEAEFSFVQVLFLPPNTTSLLQPMDQNVIANFKKNYLKKVFAKCFEETDRPNAIPLKDFFKSHFNILDSVRLIVESWNEVSISCLNSAWKNIWPQVAHNFQGFDEEQEMNEQIIDLGRKLGLEVDENDIEELIEDHGRELSTEELQELEKTEVEEDSAEGDSTNDENSVTSEDIRDLLTAWSTVRRIVKKHPEEGVTELLSCEYEDKVIGHFKRLHLSRVKQTTLHQFFK